ncbi:isoprenylcysteine carboxylmethyltransferase family protein [Ancylobacter sonchi]|uniref:methyltransferase family protein n=1 Tax=Ancylobacter sonchi TaxID=1937790 RepID=UPI001BD2BD85|nr:isoprenylcysteine carboxylmethyltransferase family protein [Ancylobacter sonchi]MBS7534281.1 isoprenylcysteine carboxylmethyltransferase family protein [Ancylobacter sonchi]
MSSNIQSPARYTSQTRRILAIKVVALITVVLILVSHSAWGKDSLATTAMRTTGLCLIMATVIGRLWATLYIGGRKNAALITSGPYSITRNPLYFFSIAGAAGIGLVFGSLVIAGCLSSFIAALLIAKARDEAAMLGARFGVSYQAYAARVPLLWPRPSLYRDADAPSFLPHALHRALRDGSLFLLSVPMGELVAYAKDVGLLPELIALF